MSVMSSILNLNSEVYMKPRCYVIFSLHEEAQIFPFRAMNNAALTHGVTRNCFGISSQKLTHLRRSKIMMLPTMDGTRIECVSVFQSLDQNVSDKSMNEDINVLNKLYKSELCPYVGSRVGPQAAWYLNTVRYFTIIMTKEITAVSYTHLTLPTIA